MNTIMQDNYEHNSAGSVSVYAVFSPLRALHNYSQSFESR